MLIGAMLVNTDHATLEDAKITFNRVGRYRLAFLAASGILLGGMVDSFMASKLAARLVIGVQFIGMQCALPRGIHHQYVAQALACQIVDLDRTGATAAFH